MDNRDIYAIAAKLAFERRPFAMAVVVDTKGSAPRKPGARMVVDAHRNTHGTVGGGAPESLVIERAAAMLAGRSEPELLEADLTGQDGICGGKITIFIEPHYAPDQVIVFGAGHVAEHTCPLLCNLGFDVTVYDFREDRLALPAFSSCRRLHASFEDVAGRLPEEPENMYVVMTPSHTHDYDVLRALVERPWRYLGVMSSKRKRAELVARLEKEGVSRQRVEAVTMPVGLPIASQTPEEIGVSIAAQLIQERARTRR